MPKTWNIWSSSHKRKVSSYQGNTSLQYRDEGQNEVTDNGRYHAVDHCGGQEPVTTSTVEHNDQNEHSEHDGHMGLVSNTQKSDMRSRQRERAPRDRLNDQTFGLSSAERHMEDVASSQDYNYTNKKQYNTTNNASQYDERTSLENVAGGHPLYQGLWSWIPHVQQSADDSTVVDKVKDLFLLAESFVHNFYLDRPYNGGIPDGILDRINYTAMDVNTLQNELKHADHQIPIIKHILIKHLLSVISFDSPPKTGSLLPNEFQNYNILAEARQNSTTSSDEDPYLQPALSAYRVLTAYLHPNAQNDGQLQSRQQPIIMSITKSLDSAFRHWVKQERRSEERQTILNRLLENTRDLGIFLFSQPSIYLFHWGVTSSDHTKQIIPIWPRMLKVFDSRGKKREMSDELIGMKFGSIFDGPAMKHRDSSISPVQHSENVPRTRGEVEDPRQMTDIPSESDSADTLPAPRSRPTTQEIRSATNPQDQSRNASRLAKDLPDVPTSAFSEERVLRSDHRSPTATQIRSIDVYDVDEQHLTPELFDSNTNPAQAANLANRSAPRTQQRIRRRELPDPRINTDQVAYTPDDHHRSTDWVEPEQRGRTSHPYGIRGPNSQAKDSLIANRSPTLPHVQSPYTFATNALATKAWSSETAEEDSCLQGSKADGPRRLQNGMASTVDQSTFGTTRYSWQSPNALPFDRLPNTLQYDSGPWKGHDSPPPSYSKERTLGSSRDRTRQNLSLDSKLPAHYLYYPDPNAKRRSRSASPPNMKNSRQSQQNRRRHQAPPNAHPIQKLMANSEMQNGNEVRSRQNGDRALFDSAVDVTGQIAAEKKEKKRSSSANSITRITRGVMRHLDGKSY